MVRAMVEAGSAVAVMGDHEFNAIAWHTPDAQTPGEYLRARYREPWRSRNRHQHAAFLTQVETSPALHAEVVDWFLTLPLWLDLPELRLVHACLHQPDIAWLGERLHEGRFLSPELLVEACIEPNSVDKDGLGPLIALYNGHHFSLMVAVSCQMTVYTKLITPSVRLRW
jgi:hypothetical protein